MKVLVACEFSGIVRDAFIAKGHDAISCDLLPTERPGPHYQGDVRELLREPWDLVVAHPPCNHLTQLKDMRPSNFDDDEFLLACDFFAECLDANAPLVAVENPRMCRAGKLVFGQPSTVVQPWHFGHPYRKWTGLWLKGLPGLMATLMVEPVGSWVLSGKTNGAAGKAKDHAGEKGRVNRSKERSRFWPGIAAAMAHQWGS